MRLEKEKNMNTKNSTRSYKSQLPSNPLLSGMASATNAAFTENGALSNKSSLDACVDFFAKGAALRQASDKDVVGYFSKAFAHDRLVALKTLFYFRDARSGQGEKRAFRVILKWLANNYPDIVVANFTNIPFFGRYDDFYELVDTPVESKMFEFLRNQLHEDAVNLLENKPVSLLAKWLKSVNTSSAESRNLGYRTLKAFGLTPKKYRQILSRLRKYIDVTEVKLSDKSFGEIDYSKVPSNASLRYRKAFLKNDADRYKDYLSKVEKGEAKINSATLYPYDIVRPIEIGRESNLSTLKTLDLQWKNLPDYLAQTPHKGIVVADTSGSMTACGNGNKVPPILVSLSLAIYFAERNKGPFENAFITYSTDPKLQIISGNTIAEKVRNLSRDGWLQSTNIQAVFDLILKTAVKNKVSQEDMVEYLYVVSDMSFDKGDSYNSRTNFDVIKQKYAVAGYALPKLIWWNVNAKSDSPVTVNDQGTCLVSGCSPSILQSVLSAKHFSPIGVMLEAINKPRYDVVKV
jgi:Domain of unknown function (DUF2828)